MTAQVSLQGGVSGRKGCEVETKVARSALDLCESKADMHISGDAGGIDDRNVRTNLEPFASEMKRRVREQDKMLL